MTAAADTLIPSTRRPIPLASRADLVSERVMYQGVEYWVVKDPVGLKYYRLQSEQYEILQLLDGRRGLEEMREAFHRKFPTVRLEYAYIQQLVTDLHSKGLAISNRPGQGRALLEAGRKRRRQQRLKNLTNVLYVRLPGWDAERTLQRLYPWTKWLYQPWAVVVAMVLVLSSWTLLLVQHEEFMARIPEFHQFFGWPNLLWLWVTLGIVKVIHEFGHGLTCKHYRGECHEMGMLFLVFSPCLYCDVTDSWLVRSKWKRIMIAAAGMYIEVVISALAVFCWWWTKPGLLNHLALNVFFVSTITTVIFNANPLLRFDGYYMMADLLEIPNLRPKANRLLRECFAWYCLGIESPTDPFMPERGTIRFITYSIAAAVYRWVILFSIVVFLCAWLKPYGLEAIGIGLAVLSLTSIAFNMVLNVYRIISAPRSKPMNYYKVAATVVVLGAMGFGLSLVPIPWHVEAPFLIEPEGVTRIYVERAGTLSEMAVEPGQEVKQGDVLARLSDLELDQRIRELEVSRAMRAQELSVYRHLDRLSDESLAEQRLKSVERELQQLRDVQKSLVVLAPCDGRVIAPPPKRESNVSLEDRQPGDWRGTPLDRRNLGIVLDRGTHLMSLAPKDTFQAVLLIDQADRADVTTGQRVELKFQHMTQRTYDGTISEISRRHTAFAPILQTNKTGGDLPAVTDGQGREQLTSAAYQMTVVLDDDTRYLLPDMRGRARCAVDTRTVGLWFWRSFRRTFHFRL